MEKIIYYNELYDYYKNLLTNKQKVYYESYYFDDLSLQEIAENNNISRNAVHTQLKSTIEKLDFYEKNLKLNKKGKEIKLLIKDIDNDLKSKINDLV